MPYRHPQPLKTPLYFVSKAFELVLHRSVSPLCNLDFNLKSPFQFAISKSIFKLDLNWIWYAIDPFFSLVREIAPGGRCRMCYHKSVHSQRGVRRSGSWARGTTRKLRATRSCILQEGETAGWLTTSPRWQVESKVLVNHANLQTCAAGLGLGARVEDSGSWIQGAGFWVSAFG